MNEFSLKKTLRFCSARVAVQRPDGTSGAAVLGVDQPARVPGPLFCRIRPHFGASSPRYAT